MKKAANAINSETPLLPAAAADAFSSGLSTPLSIELPET
jgi:hypothetical protein